MAQDTKKKTNSWKLNFRFISDLASRLHFYIVFNWFFFSFFFLLNNFLYFAICTLNRTRHCRYVLRYVSYACKCTTHFLKWLCFACCTQYPVFISHDIYKYNKYIDSSWKREKKSDSQRTDSRTHSTRKILIEIPFWIAAYFCVLTISHSTSERTNNGVYFAAYYIVNAHNVYHCSGGYYYTCFFYFIRCSSVKCYRALPVIFLVYVLTCFLYEIQSTQIFNFVTSVLDANAIPIAISFVRN